MDKSRVEPIYSETFFGHWNTCPECGASWGGGEKEKCYNCGVRFEEKGEDLKIKE